MHTLGRLLPGGWLVVSKPGVGNQILEGVRAGPLEIADGADGIAQILARHQVALILWPGSTAAQGLYARRLEALRRSPEWRTVYDDSRGVVFAHVERGRAWIDAQQAFALQYPDVPSAQLFLADAYFAANQFDRARQLMQAVVNLAREIPDPTANDDHIRDRIMRTAQETAWCPIGFQVTVRNGVVHLHGLVVDERARQAAIVAAENTAGVKEVHDHICWVDGYSGYYVESEEDRKAAS